MEAFVFQNHCVCIWGERPPSGPLWESKMKKSGLIALVVQVVVLAGLPALNLIFGSLDIYFAVDILILLVIHPTCSLGMGIFAGLDIRARWWLLLSGPLLALCAEWIFFALEMDFLIYAGINFLLGIVGMVSTILVRQVILKKG